MVILALWTMPAQAEQELSRQRDQIRDLETRVGVQETETADLRLAMARQTPCTADLVPTDPRSVDVTANPGTVLRLGLLATVSRPAERCLNADVWVTGTYLDASGEVVCSGSVKNFAEIASLSGSLSVEIRPLDLIQFARWANQPPRTEAGFLRLRCMSADGLVEVRTLPDVVATLLIRVSLFPPNGGLATSDFRVNLR
jgi:hypothetical protein